MSNYVRVCGDNCAEGGAAIVLLLVMPDASGGGGVECLEDQIQNEQRKKSNNRSSNRPEEQQQPGERQQHKHPALSASGHQQQHLNQQQHFNHQHSSESTIVSANGAEVTHFLPPPSVCTGLLGRVGKYPVCGKQDTVSPLHASIRLTNNSNIRCLSSRSDQYKNPLLPLPIATSWLWLSWLSQLHPLIPEFTADSEWDPAIFPTMATRPRRKEVQSYDRQTRPSELREPRGEWPE
ncbi:hypothetical protein FPQ18DRAFT_378310 [Pyronema domesticum]|nr:hypothetical protein FPQ18DRAFT_378310 [Pyronema domesticum]